MDKEMIERCAKALAAEVVKFTAANVQGSALGWDAMALIVIKAMREPTAKMLEAADGPWCDDDRPSLKSEYQVMIDAITGAE